MTKAVLRASGIVQRYVTGAGLAPGQREKAKGRSQMLA